MKKNIAFLILSIFIFTLLVDCSYGQSHVTKPPLRVLLHFDDSYIGIYKNAFPQMQEYGYKGTIFVPTNLVDQPGHTQLEHLVEMKAAGWEIGSHTRTHPDLSKVDRSVLYDEIVGSRNILIGNQFCTLENAFFCSPMTVWTDKVQTLVKNHYVAARGKKLEIFGLKTQPTQHLRVILKDTTITTIEYWINQAINSDSWLILIFHEVAFGGNEYFFPPDQFQKTLELLKQYQVRVLTIEEAIELMTNN